MIILYYHLRSGLTSTQPQQQSPSAGDLNSSNKNINPCNNHQRVVLLYTQVGTCMMYMLCLDDFIIALDIVFYNNNNIYHYYYYCTHKKYYNRDLAKRCIRKPVLL